MKKIILACFLSLFTSSVFAALDKCEMQGNLASHIIGYKSQKAPLEYLIKIFPGWIGSALASHDVTDADKTIIADWADEKGINFNAWIEQVYNSYGVNYLEAQAKEKQACLDAEAAK